MTVRLSKSTLTLLMGIHSLVTFNLFCVCRLRWRHWNIKFVHRVHFNDTWFFARNERLSMIWFIVFFLSLKIIFTKWLRRLLNELNINLILLKKRNSGNSSELYALRHQWHGANASYAECLLYAQKIYALLVNRPMIAEYIEYWKFTWNFVEKW